MTANGAILAFHSIDDGGSVLSYPRAELQRLIDGLGAEGVRFVRLEELLQESPEPRPRVAVTFDDGMRSVRREALPVLAAAKVPFTVFVVADFVGRDNGWPSQPAGIPRFELMDWSELAELRDAGAELGGHTATHPRLRGADDGALARELAGSRKRLEERLAVPVRSFAYPYGSFDERTVAAVRAEYSLAVTTRLAFVGGAADGRDRHRLPRLDSWYLRGPERRLPLFGGRSRARLALRAWLRRVREVASGARGPGGPVGAAGGYGA